MATNVSQFSTEMMDDLNSSNTTPSTTPFAPQPTPQQYDVYRQLKFYLLAFIIPVGILFNLLSCAVFLRSRMRKSATVFYFFALACADNIVLTGELFLWLNAYTTSGNITGLRFMQEIDGVCKLVHFLRYFGRLFSSWLVVAICIERFITVAYPLKSTWSSTPKKAKMVIAGLIIVCLILACPAFFAVGSVYSKKYNQLRCNILNYFREDYGHWVLFVMIFGELVIPSIIVIIFTVLIIVKLMIAHRQRFFAKEGQGKGQNRKDNQPTIALLAVSIAFVTLRTPYVFVYPLYMMRHQVFGSLTGWQLLQLEGAYNITFILAVTNYAVNFLLYIVTGKTFRGEFKRFLLCQTSKLGPTWSRSYSMTSQTTSIRRLSKVDMARLRNNTMDDKNGPPLSPGTPPARYIPIRQDSRF